VRFFYKQAPLALATLGIAVGLTGYYLDIVLRVSFESLLWAGIALLLGIAGFTAGRLVQRLDLSAHTDFLTGLWNRRYFYLQLGEEEARATRKHEQLCIAMIDIDNFKAINDRYGHAAGDMLLSDLATMFRKNVRDTDIVTRWGGDEFAIIFSGASLMEAYEIMERIRQKVEARFNSSYGLAISAGIIALEPDRELEDLLVLVDQALYKAKEQKNSVITITDLPC
jgi:diguanylate cyclase (GGDEF)-like protein